MQAARHRPPRPLPPRRPRPPPPPVVPSTPGPPPFFSAVSVGRGRRRPPTGGRGWRRGSGGRGGGPRDGTRWARTGASEDRGLGMEAEEERRRKEGEEEGEEGRCGGYDGSCGAGDAATRRRPWIPPPPPLPLPRPPRRWTGGGGGGGAGEQRGRTARSGGRPVESRRPHATRPPPRRLPLEEKARPTSLRADTAGGAVAQSEGERQSAEAGGGREAVPCGTSSAGRAAAVRWWRMREAATSASERLGIGWEVEGERGEKAQRRSVGAFWLLSTPTRSASFRGKTISVVWIYFSAADALHSSPSTQPQGYPANTALQCSHHSAMVSSPPCLHSMG